MYASLFELSVHRIIDNFLSMNVERLFICQDLRDIIFIYIFCSIVNHYVNYNFFILIDDGKFSKGYGNRYHLYNLHALACIILTK